MQKHKSLIPYVGESWLWPLDQPLTVFKDTIAPVLKRCNSVTPNESLIFRAFLECPFDTVRVVIIGQDPYHTPGKATGLCFDTPSGVLAPSLTNILKEIKKDYGTSLAETNKLSNLEHLPGQGVLLLNSALTTEEGQAGAHLKLWQQFMELTVESLNKRPQLVWVLWGKKAQKLRSKINPKHDVVVGAHPSPYSYHDTWYDAEKTLLKARGFVDNGFFRKINSLLTDKITW